MAAAHPVFGPEDLLILGVGLDFAGAWLVSRGLLQSVRQLAASGGTVRAMERPLAPDAVEDRCRASVGLVSLAASFLPQTSGYVAFLAGAKVQRGMALHLVGLLPPAALSSRGAGPGHVATGRAQVQHLVGTLSTDDVELLVAAR